MTSGGVYFLVSHVLGARIGAAIGILYCFGQVRQTIGISDYIYLTGKAIINIFHKLIIIIIFINKVHFRSILSYRMK